MAISGVASGTGFGLGQVLSKAGKLSRAGRVIEKASKKRVPLTNYWKEQVNAAKAGRRGAAGAAAGFAGAQLAKKLVDAPSELMDEQSTDENDEVPSSAHGGKPCP